MIAMTEALAACKDEPDLETRIKKAMIVCKNHWMCTIPDERFKAALAAALSATEDATEYDRIERSFEQVRFASAALYALTAGLPLDLEKLAAKEPDPDLIPLLNIWHGI